MHFELKCILFFTTVSGWVCLSQLAEGQSARPPTSITRSLQKIISKRWSLSGSGFHFSQHCFMWVSTVYPRSVCCDHSQIVVKSAHCNVQNLPIKASKPMHFTITHTHTQTLYTDLGFLPG